MYNNFPSNSAYPYGYPYQPYPRQMAAPQDGTLTNAPGVVQSAMYAQPSAAPNYIKGRPVVSIDEARASQIDLDGSLHVFPDLGNKRIYTKQINLDGTATFNVFVLDNQTQPMTEISSTEYVTKEELNAILEQFKQSLTTPKAASSKTAAPITF